MVIVILPAYNEEEALPLLLDALELVHKESLPDIRVIVVDDGSKDKTTTIVRAKQEDYSWLRLVEHGHNRGLSQAIQTGFKVALAEASPDDIIVTLDADNTQLPETIPSMLAQIEVGADVVVASRFQPGAKVHGVPFMRRLYSQVMSLLFQIAFPVPNLRDYSCGFRAYRSEVLRQAYTQFDEDFITEEGFACMVEILFQLNRLPNVTFAEVPFILRYDQKPTKTKMRVLQTIKDTLRLALTHRFTKPSIEQTEKVSVQGVVKEIGESGNKEGGEKPQR